MNLFNQRNAYQSYDFDKKYGEGFLDKLTEKELVEDLLGRFDKSLREFTEHMKASNRPDKHIIIDECNKRSDNLVASLKHKFDSDMREEENNKSNNIKDSFEIQALARSIELLEDLQNKHDGEENVQQLDLLMRDKLTPIIVNAILGHIFILLGMASILITLAILVVAPPFAIISFAVSIGLLALGIKFLSYDSKPFYSTELFYDTTKFLLNGNAFYVPLELSEICEIKDYSEEEKRVFITMLDMDKQLENLGVYELFDKLSTTLLDTFDSKLEEVIKALGNKGYSEDVITSYRQNGTQFKEAFQRSEGGSIDIARALQAMARSIKTFENFLEGVDNTENNKQIQLLASDIDKYKSKTSPIVASLKVLGNDLSVKNNVAQVLGKQSLFASTLTTEPTTDTSYSQIWCMTG